MKKRFMVALYSSTPEQDRAFRAYVKSERLGWWHWLPNVWLLATGEHSKITAVQLRNKLDSLYPTINKIVLEFSSEGDTWAGFGPNKAEGKDMFRWIRENWQQP